MKTIDKFHKNSVEIVKVNLQEWKDQTYVDVRVWHLDSPAEEGSETATRKGITLNVELLSNLIRALKKAQEALKEEG